MFTFGYRFKRIKVGVSALFLASFQVANKQNGVTVVPEWFYPLSLSLAL